MTKAEKGPQNGILAFFLVFWLIWGVVGVYNYFTDHDNTSFALSVVSVTLVVFIAASRYASASFKKKLAAFLLSSLVSVYLFEMLLQVLPGVGGDLAQVRAVAAKRQGIDFDKRDKLHVLLDLRRTGEAWYPAVCPYHFMANNLVKVAGKDVLPMAGIGSAKVVDCNENGYYATTTTDELGFANPPGIWLQKARLDAVLLGDSFTKGCCVRDNESIAARLRVRQPRTVSLGSMGNGPLVMLGTINEYLQERELGVVFWLYYEGNDLADLYFREILQPTLLKYLDDPHFSQGLEQNQAAVNAALKQYVDQNTQLAAAHLHPLQDFAMARLSIATIRAALFNLKSVWMPPKTTPYELTTFTRVLRAAKERIEKRGGKLVFVYLPEHGRYADNRWVELSGAHLKKRVLQTAADVGLDVVDIDPVFTKLKDPRSVFPFGMFGHYNADGYRLVAKQLSDYLDRSKAAVGNDAK